MASVTSCVCAREGLGCLSMLVEPAHAHAVDQYSLHLSSPMRLWHLPCQRTPLGCNLVSTL